MTLRALAIDPNSLVIDPTLISLYSQPVFIAMPSLTMFAIAATIRSIRREAAIHALNVGMATSALGSQTNFGRILLDNSTYYPIKKNWVIARRTQIGIERPYGTNEFIDSARFRRIPSRWRPPQIPLPELFFAGGSNSLRSFSINQAGPRDPETGYPIGGQGLFVNNIELRTPPVSSHRGRHLDSYFFTIWATSLAPPTTSSAGSFDLHQPSLADCSGPSSKAFATSTTTRRPSAWVRYKTPVGPVALTWATPSTRHATPFRNRMKPSHCDGSTSFSVLDRLSNETHFVFRDLFRATVCDSGVPASAGEVIDGVVASVNRQPVLRSDWEEAIAFEAFMQQKPLAPS